MKWERGQRLNSTTFLLRLSPETYLRRASKYGRARLVRSASLPHTNRYSSIRSFHSSKRFTLQHQCVPRLRSAPCGICDGDPPPSLRTGLLFEYDVEPRSSLGLTHCAAWNHIQNVLLCPSITIIPPEINTSAISLVTRS